MTGKSLWEQYQHYTRDFTDHARKLGFGGAAVCWLFRDAHFRFPVVIYVSLLFFVFYFICDIFQSVSGALSIKFFTEREEKRLWESTGSIEGEIHKPKWVDYPAFLMFCMKSVFLVAGFLFIAFELLARLDVSCFS